MSARERRERRERVARSRVRALEVLGPLFHAHRASARISVRKIATLRSRRSRAFISLADSAVNATVTALFFLRPYRPVA